MSQQSRRDSRRSAGLRCDSNRLWGEVLGCSVGLNGMFQSCMGGPPLRMKPR